MESSAPEGIAPIVVRQADERDTADMQRRSGNLTVPMRR